MHTFSFRNKKVPHRYFKDSFSNHLNPKNCKQANQTNSQDKVSIKLIDLNEISDDASPTLSKNFQLHQKSTSHSRKLRLSKIINCSMNKNRFKESTIVVKKVKNVSDDYIDLIESAKARLKKDELENLKKTKEEKYLNGLIVSPSKDKYVKFKKYLVTDHNGFNKSWRISQRIKHLDRGNSYETESSSSPNVKNGFFTPYWKS